MTRDVAIPRKPLRVALLLSGPALFVVIFTGAAILDYNEWLVAAATSAFFAPAAIVPFLGPPFPECHRQHRGWIEKQHCGARNRHPGEFASYALLVIVAGGAVALSAIMTNSLAFALTFLFFEGFVMVAAGRRPSQRHRRQPGRVRAD